MSLSVLISFLFASVMLAIMPGPDNIFVLTESITRGYKNGVAISIGLCCGILIHMLVATTGLSLVIQQSSLLYDGLKYAGACYLLYLAYLATKETAMSVNDIQADSKDNKAFYKLVKKGFFMNVLNPKVTIFFIAFLPLFVSEEGWSIKLQMIVLGIVFMVQAFVVFSGISILSGLLTKYVNSPTFWKYMKWIKVFTLTLLAIALMTAQK